jgi:diguanylate cyclase (GGDEF)-like protein/PAS domain S-box-containing protein
MADRANEYLTQVSEQTAQQLATYTALPPKLALGVAQDITAGRIQLNTPNFAALDRYFLERSRNFPEVSFIYVGTAQGRFIGAGRRDTPLGDAPQSRLSLVDDSTKGQYQVYSVSLNGQRGQIRDRRPNYNVRQQPWYQAGIASQKPIWTAPYVSMQPPNAELTMTAVQPLRRAGQVMGVVGVDLALRDLSQYLQDQRVSRSGQVMILAPDGALIATSTGASLYHVQDNQAPRLNAFQDTDAVTRETMAQLRGKLDTAQSLQATIAGESRFIRVTPWQIADGLNWRIVVVVPAQEFTQQIQANQRTTWLLSGLALLGAVGLSAWIARRAAKPIAQLSQATQEVARGKRRQIVTPQPTWELTELSNSVNHMADRLQRSLSNLQTLNQALFTSEQRLQQILEALPVGILVLAPDGKCLYFNRTGQLLFGRSQPQPIALAQLPQAYRLYQANTNTFYPWEQLPIVQALNGKAVYVDDLEVRLNHATIPLEARAVPVTDATGKVIYAIQTFQNVTVRKQAEVAKQQSEQRLQTLMDNVPGMIFRYVIGPSGQEQFTYVSPHAIDLFEIDAVTLQQDSQQFWSLVLPEDEVATRHRLREQQQAMQPWSVEYRIRTKTGQLKWLHTNASPDRAADGTIVWDGLTVDITERKQAETVLYDYRQHLEQQVQARTIALQQANQELERLATLDGLTQIANRRRFDRYLEQEWQRQAREQQPLSLILCDIDYFKRYNDRYGHQQGDYCLQQVVQRLHATIKRPADLLARYGGEEFAVILPQTNRWGATQVAEALRVAVQQLQLPHQDSPISDYVSISAGVATLLPTLNGNPQRLIMVADQALYQAKQQGRDRVCLGKTAQTLIPSVS